MLSNDSKFTVYIPEVFIQHYFTEGKIFVKAGWRVLENLAWEMFQLTGNIDEYLLYKNAEPEETEPAEQLQRADGWTCV